MITTINEFKLITERFVNLWNKKDMTLYIDEIYNILVKSYEKIGGFLTANSPEELLNKCDFIKVVTRNNKITAVSCYKLTKYGKKRICMGTDQTEQGKSDAFMIINEDIKLKERLVYSEVSGKLEHIVLKFGALPLPNYLVSDIIEKDVDLDSDGYHYYRDIKGQRVKKLLVGTVNIPE